MLNSEIIRLTTAVKSEAEKFIVFQTITYLKTETFKKFKTGESIYHVFGAINAGIMQSVVYSPTNNTIEFSLHSIKVEL